MGKRRRWPKNVGLAPGAKKKRRGRSTKDRRKKINESVWNLRFREFLAEAPKNLGPEKANEWALQEMRKKYRFYGQEKK